MGRVRRLVEPLERHVAEQREVLGAAGTELESARNEAGLIREEVKSRFGEPGG